MRLNQGGHYSLVLIVSWTKPLGLYFECVDLILKRRGWTLGLDWCRDAPCGMGVISCPSRLISKGSSRRGAHCWLLLSAKNNDSDRTSKWHCAGGDWQSKWRGYGDGVQKGTRGRQEGTERHFMSRGGLKNVGIWPRQRAAHELGLSGGIRGDRIEMSWSGTLPLSHTHRNTHIHTHTSPGWHSARPFCGSNALKLQTPPHPQRAAVESLQSSTTPIPLATSQNQECDKDNMKIRMIMSQRGRLY